MDDEIKSLDKDIKKWASYAEHLLTSRKRNDRFLPAMTGKHLIDIIYRQQQLLKRFQEKMNAEQK